MHGWTENAGVENERGSKLSGLESTGVENTGAVLWRNYETLIN